MVMYMADSQNSLALGGSFAASSNLAGSAMTYPGLYGLLDRQSLTLGHSQLFQGTRYDSLTYAYPTLRRGTFGVGLFSLGSQPAPGRDSSGNLAGSFSQSEVMARFGYGSYILPQVAWGMNLSFLQRQLGSAQSGFSSVSLGAHYRGYHNLNTSLSVDNIASLKTGETEDKLSPGMRLSASYDIWPRMLTLGTELTTNPALEYRIGFQYALTDNFKLSLGRNNTTSGMGIELKVRNFRFDYNLGLNDLGYSNQIGLSTFFGRSRVESREELARGYFSLVRKLAGQGRYAEALQSLQNGQRYGQMPVEMRVLAQGLQALAAGQVYEMRGQGGLQTLARKGVSLYLDDKQQLARDVLLQVRAGDPRNMVVARLLALPGLGETERGGKTGESASELPKFTDVDPIKLKLFKTEEYFKKQQWDLALKECKDILAINPREVLAYVRLGSILYALGMKSEAAESWQYARRIDPTNPQVITAMQFMRQVGLDKDTGDLASHRIAAAEVR